MTQYTRRGIGREIEKLSDDPDRGATQDGDKRTDPERGVTTPFVTFEEGSALSEKVPEGWTDRVEKSDTGATFHVVEREASK